MPAPIAYGLGVAALKGYAARTTAIKAGEVVLGTGIVAGIGVGIESAINGKDDPLDAASGADSEFDNSNPCTTGRCKSWGLAYSDKKSNVYNNDSAEGEDSDNLEEGQTVDENGRVHNADGTFASGSTDPDARHDRNSGYPHSVKDRDKIIDKFRDENGDVIDPESGKVIPEDQVTIEHIKPVVDDWNENGKNSGQKERNDSFNDPDNLSVKSKSDNSREGAKLGRTYDQDTGPNYTPN